MVDLRFYLGMGLVEERQLLLVGDYYWPPRRWKDLNLALERYLVKRHEIPDWREPTNGSDMVL